MPNKTIYFREEDRKVWEKAEEFASGSLSALISQSLRRYVEEEEMLRAGSGMEPIQVALWVAHTEEPYFVEFVGRWILLPDEEETRTAEPGYDAGAYYGVALTQRGNIAVYTRHVNNGFAPTLDVYGSFEEAEREGAPADILAMAASGIGANYTHKLDI